MSTGTADLMNIKYMTTEGANALLAAGINSFDYWALVKVKINVIKNSATSRNAFRLWWERVKPQLTYIPPEIKTILSAKLWDGNIATSTLIHWQRSPGIDEFSIYAFSKTSLSKPSDFQAKYGHDVNILKETRILYAEVFNEIDMTIRQMESLWSDICVVIAYYRDTSGNSGINPDADSPWGPPSGGMLP